MNTDPQASEDDSERDTERASERDEELDDAAQGVNATSDDAADDSSEIDAIGEAAGLVAREGKPFRGIEEVDRRDEHRWELDPASAETDGSTD